MRATVLVGIAAATGAACGTYNYNRAALVPRATPQLHSGMPLDTTGEISFGASSVANIGNPGVGDPEAGVEIPGTQLFGHGRLKLGRLSLGFLYQHGLDATAKPLKSTQPPVDGGDVQGFGLTTDIAIDTPNPNVKVGLGIEAMTWSAPYVEYYTCADVEPCFPYSVVTSGKDRVPTIGASLTPSYRTGNIVVFGGLTARQHPTLQQKGSDRDPLFTEPEVESGPFNFIISGGAELALADGKFKASAIAYWDMTQNPARYGPGVAIVLAVPLGRRADADPGPTAPPLYQVPPPPVYPYPPAPPPPVYPPAPPEPPPAPEPTAPPTP